MVVLSFAHRRASNSLFKRYNGHPDFAHLSGDIHAALSSSDTVTVVGAGNVALDCARVLIKGEKRVANNTVLCNDHTSSRKHNLCFYTSQLGDTPYFI